MLPRHSSACAPPLPPPALPLPLLPLPPSLPPASCASASASTSMPRAMSPGVANSSGLWLQPLRQGMKTIPVGAICGGSMQGMCVAQTNIMACIKQQQQWNGSNTSRRARLNMQSPVPCSGIMKTHTIGESASKTMLLAGQAAAAVQASINQCSPAPQTARHGTPGWIQNPVYPYQKPKPCKCGANPACAMNSAPWDARSKADIKKQKAKRARTSA